MLHPGIIILLICLFLLLVIAAEHAARRWSLPAPTWLLLAGLAYGLAGRLGWGSLPAIAFAPDLVVFGFLPVLIFAASRKLPVRPLVAEGVAVAWLSAAGPLIGMVLLAVPLVVIGRWPWSHALLFGVALSPTDPLAVGAMLKKQRAPKRLAILIEGESLFNDALAVVLFSLLAGSVVGSSEFKLGATLSGIGYSLFGAIVLGGAAGGIAGALLRWWHDLHDRFVGAILPLILVYGVFALAHSVLHVSGVVAVVVCTLVLGGMHTHCHDPTDMQKRADNFFDDFWQFLDTLAGAILFFGLGAMVGRHEWRLPWILVPAVCALLLISRVATVYPLGVIARLTRQRLPMNWRHALAASGLRGALSVALLLSLPADYERRTAMICLAFALVLFSLVAYLVTATFFLSGLDFEAEEKR
ncbi:MAG: cation:proton antiporter [Lentisphaeria bacterium]|nr:cation:proton antiporter [Lentisphaeria bacterium]